jgi:hypothetical protein
LEFEKGRLCFPCKRKLIQAFQLEMKRKERVGREEENAAR